MRVVTFFFCLFFSIIYFQNKNQNFIQIDIDACRIPLNDSLSVFKLNYNLFSNDIKFILKTENAIANKCSEPYLSNDLKEKINISQNPIIKINNRTIECNPITDFTNLIPKKIISLKKKNYSVIIIEIYSFSYSTVGSGYIYQCFKLDLKGNVIIQKKLESKSPIKESKYKKIF